MKKSKYTVLLLIIGALMFLLGCKTQRPITKYGAPPVHKEDVKSN